MNNLDQILTDDFSVSEIDLKKAKAYQEKYGGRLEKLLVNMGSLSEDSLVHLYAKLLNLPVVVDISDEEIEKVKLDYSLLNANLCHPLCESNGKIRLLLADPFDWEVNQYLNNQGIEFDILLADKSLVEQAIISNSGDAEDIADDQVLSEFEEDRLRELATEAPTVNLLNNLIAKAMKINASDMHLEPVENRYRVRYRVDGVLSEGEYLPSSLQLAAISRIKILSNMDVAEKRRPQDGKIETKISNTELDIRVSVLPLNKGESVVMRFLKKDSVTYDMDVLGISADIREKVAEDLKATAGVILLTGPTGSGKTTSLYTFLNELNDDEVKIITLEDPVEYQLDGVNQVQVNAEIGFDFAAGLRSIVRQDPDIIMLGEIRDHETARIAMQSALTGHLVFSTVHTNDAPSAYTRLIDLGVEEFLLNAAIVSVLAQRLVRKVCPHCATPTFISQNELDKYNIQALSERFNIAQPNFVNAEGCESCGGTGYRGRMAIIEYLPCNEDIRNLSKDDYFIPKAKEINQKLGNRTLFEDGLLKAMQGYTTVDEVVRVCS